MLDTLISSKTRVKLLLKFFLNTSTSSYLRGLESEFGEYSNAILLELNKLEGAGLLTSNIQGNKRFFRANTEHPMFDDINRIVFKFTGLDKLVERIVEGLGDLKSLYLVGDLATGLKSDVVDLVFVGNIDKNYLFELVQKVETKLQKKVKYIAYNNSEFSPEVVGADHQDYLLLWSK
jgi:DNA-binding transcriptional ArsR family regulator